MYYTPSIYCLESYKIQSKDKVYYNKIHVPVLFILLVMDTLFILSSIAICLSIYNNITPLLAVLARAKSNNLEQIPVNFLKINHACQLFWLIYGFRLMSMTVIIANLFTFAFSMISLFAYVIAANKFNSFLSYYLSSFAVFIATAYIVLSTEFIGLLAFISSLVTSVSTLECIQKAFQMKNHNCIDLNMSLSGAMNGLAWTLFGVLTDDLVTIAASGFGLLLSLAMVLSYFYLKNTYKND